MIDDRPGLSPRLIQPFVRRAAGVEDPGAERRAERPSSRQVQDSMGAQAASKAALGPGSEPRAAGEAREHGENPPFDAAEHYGCPCAYAGSNSLLNSGSA